MSLSSTKIVAKNTVIMFIRMIILMVIAFYSSRLLLATLGISDYGVFSVVGSISSTFVAIKSLFSESIQRFFNVAKGKTADSLKEQQAIFNMSIIVHIVLIICFVIVVELVGGWLLNNKLDIPSGRMDAATFVFHMTVIATTIGIISVPYDAVIVANEKMSVFAGITVFDALLRLLFIFLLPVIGFDYLKVYSILLVIIPITTILIQFFYCRRFPECQYKLTFDKRLFKEIMGLSGWNFFGNISFSIIHEGINMLLNIYGGVVMNASRAIAYQVKNVANQISTNTLVAARPRVMQQSVQKSKEQYFEDIFLLSRISYFSLALAIVPLFVYCPQLLSIWLTEVPEASTTFTRLVLIGLFIRSLHEPLNIMNMAYASIKRMMLIEVVSMLSSLVVIYFVLRNSALIWFPFAYLSCMEAIIITGLIINAKYELGFPIRKYLKKVIRPMLLFSLISSVFGFILHYAFKPSTVVSVLLCVLLIVIVEMIFCWIFFNTREKQLVLKFIDKN